MLQEHFAAYIGMDEQQDRNFSLCWYAS